MTIGGFDSSFAVWLDGLFWRNLCKVAFTSDKVVVFFPMVSAQSRNSLCPPGDPVTWGWFVRSLRGDFVLS